jgi:ATP-dependent Lhr-like helicase
VSASPYKGLTREAFDKVVGFVATGGYALANCERYTKLKKTPDGEYRLADPRIAQQYRLNVGSIVEAPMLRVRLARPKGNVRVAGRVLGVVEEYFIEQLTPGDTFVFAGEVLRFEGLREMDAIVTRAHATDPKVPAYEGGKFPLSTYLAERAHAPRRPQTLVAASRAGLRLDPPASSVLGRARSGTKSWSRPSRAAIDVISSAIRSRGGSPIRASACC